MKAIFVTTKKIEKEEEKTVKKIKIVSILLFFLVIFGCTNAQHSSKEEAFFIIQQRTDFQENVQYFSIESWAKFVGWPGYPSINKSDPEIENDRFKDQLVHIFIYKTKSSSFKLVFMDDGRPPKIMYIKEFK